MNDKSQVIHTGMGMDGAMMPSMQRVFVGNGANVPQMQAIPNTQATQQSSEGLQNNLPQLHLAAKIKIRSLMMSSNNYKTVRIGDGAISPKMIKVSNSNIEKHGATMPKCSQSPVNHQVQFLHRLNNEQ